MAQLRTSEIADLESIYHSRDILRTLDTISDNYRKTICLIPFGSTEEIFSLFPKKRIPLHALTVLKQKKERAIYTLEVFHRNGSTLKIKRDFILYKLPGFTYSYLMICIGNPDFLHRELKSFIKHYHREIILSFIKSHDLINLLEHYKTKNNLDEIVITRASQKIRYLGEKKISSVTWPKSSLEDASRWLDGNDGFFKSLQYKALAIGREVSNGFIDRQGAMRIERNFGKAYRYMVLPIVKYLESYIELFKNRGRRANDLEIRPLEINFKNEIFKEKSSNSDFIGILGILEDTSISVIHGNPYIHLSIMDYIDGSTCDLWVVNSQQILLVPQLHSTIGSLKRIVNHIYDYYAEGEIQEHAYKKQTGTTM